MAGMLQNTYPAEATHAFCVSAIVFYVFMWMVGTGIWEGLGQGPEWRLLIGLNHEGQHEVVSCGTHRTLCEKLWVL